MDYKFTIKDKTVTIDFEDLDKISGYSWTLKPDHNTFYVQANKKVDGKWIKITLHRLLMDFPKGLQVDHVDRDGLNNTKRNLRVCTNLENARNKKYSTGDIPNIKKTKNGKYLVRVAVNGKRISVGTFDTLEKAITARDTYINTHHKEFGVLLSDKIVNEEEIRKMKLSSDLKNEGFSGHRGIDFRHNKWRVRKQVNGKRITIGFYYSLDEAILAYKNYIGL